MVVLMADELPHGTAALVPPGTRTT